MFQTTNQMKWLMSVDWKCFMEDPTTATPQIGLVSIGGHDGMHTAIKLRLHNLAPWMSQQGRLKTEGLSFETNR